MTMRKDEFIEYCKKLDAIFDDQGHPVSVETLNDTFGPNDLIHVIEQADIVNVLIRNGNTGGTTHWRGSK